MRIFLAALCFVFGVHYASAGQFDEFAHGIDETSYILHALQKNGKGEIKMDTYYLGGVWGSKDACVTFLKEPDDIFVQALIQFKARLDVLGPGSEGSIECMSVGDARKYEHDKETKAKEREI